MKAITLHEPWAWLVAAGWKEVETRSWYTRHRGPLAIHAGKKNDVDGRILHLTLNGIRGVPRVCPEWIDLPFGAVVATCNLVSCVPIGCQTNCTCVDVTHRDAALELFRFTGRYAWLLRDVQPVTPPIPCHGWQKLWTLQGAPLAELQGRAS